MNESNYGLNTHVHWRRIPLENCVCLCGQAFLWMNRQCCYVLLILSVFWSFWGVFESITTFRTWVMLLTENKRIHGSVQMLSGKINILKTAVLNMISLGYCLPFPSLSYLRKELFCEDALNTLKLKKSQKPYFKLGKRILFLFFLFLYSFILWTISLFLYGLSWLIESL